jgi:hypothetical protein
VRERERDIDGRIILQWILKKRGRSGAAGWGTALQTGRSRLRFPMVSVDFSLT